MIRRGVINVPIPQKNFRLVSAVRPSTVTGNLREGYTISGYVMVLLQNYFDFREAHGEKLLCSIHFFIVVIFGTNYTEGFH